MQSFSFLWECSAALPCGNDAVQIVELCLVEDILSSIMFVATSRNQLSGKRRTLYTNDTFLDDYLLSLFKCMPFNIYPHKMLSFCSNQKYYDPLSC